MSNIKKITFKRKIEVTTEYENKKIKLSDSLIFEQSVQSSGACRCRRNLFSSSFLQEFEDSSGSNSSILESEDEFFENIETSAYIITSTPKKSDGTILGLEALNISSLWEETNNDSHNIGFTTFNSEDTTILFREDTETIRQLLHSEEEEENLE